MLLVRVKDGRRPQCLEMTRGYTFVVDTFYDKILPYWFDRKCFHFIRGIYISGFQCVLENLGNNKFISITSP